MYVFEKQGYTQTYQPKKLLVRTFLKVKNIHRHFNLKTSSKCGFEKQEYTRTFQLKNILVSGIVQNVHIKKNRFY